MGREEERDCKCLPQYPGAAHVECWHVSIFFTTPGLASHCSLGQTSTSNYTVATYTITMCVLICFWGG